MLALPPGPRPAPRRQVLVGTALAAVAGAMLMAGMLAIWLRFRAAAPTVEGADGLIKAWLPDGVIVPEGPTNVMLVGLIAAVIMAQWAVYSAKRQDRGHAVLALAVTFVIGVAVLNAQLFVYTQFGLALADGAYQAMFYALTGTFMALLILGLVYDLVVVFRFLGGRSAETELVSAHALYWYFLMATYAALWFVVYVQK